MDVSPVNHKRLVAWGHLLLPGTTSQAALGPTPPATPPTTSVLFATTTLTQSSTVPYMSASRSQMSASESNVSALVTSKMSTMPCAPR